jgi:aryl-alcohol dehydrogenase-like predicted oxidoreductase
LLEKSLSESLARMKLDRVDLFFLHNQIIPDGSEGQYQGTPRGLFTAQIVPAFQRLLADGRIGAWAITGIGVPDSVIETVQADPAPAAIQIITNLMDSPGALKQFDGPPKPREIIAAAQHRGVGVMGIRAVQAGALTDGFDRELPDDHPDMADFRRAQPFRELATELQESPASLAHRYSLSMEGVSTVVLGVKNRTELRECIDAEAKGRLDPSLMTRLHSVVPSA